MFDIKMTIIILFFFTSSIFIVGDKKARGVLREIIEALLKLLIELFIIVGSLIAIASVWYYR